MRGEGRRSEERREGREERRTARRSDSNTPIASLPPCLWTRFACPITNLPLRRFARRPAPPQTCKLQLTECSGHYGYINLGLPVFHIGYFKHTISVLQCVCKTCSRVLLKDTEGGKREYSDFLNKFRGKTVNSETGEVSLKAASCLSMLYTII